MSIYVPPIYIDHCSSEPVNGFSANPNKRPTQATPVMVHVAEKVVNALIESGRLSDCGDTSAKFREFEIIDMLNYFMDFTTRGKRIHENYVIGNAQALGLSHLVNPEIIINYAGFLGYRVIWSTGKTPYPVHVEVTASKL